MDTEAKVNLVLRALIEVQSLGGSMTNATFTALTSALDQTLVIDQTKGATEVSGTGSVDV